MPSFILLLAKKHQRGKLTIIRLNPTIFQQLTNLYFNFSFMRMKALVWMHVDMGGIINERDSMINEMRWWQGLWFFE